MVENIQREGLSPWQQAEELRELLAVPGATIASVARKVGWSPTVVRRRSGLLALIKPFQKAMEIGSKDYPGWTLGHFELIAAMDKAVQAQVAEQYKGDVGVSLEDLKHGISRISKELRHAPWSLDDATLDPKAGACNVCPMRSSANVDLFGESAQSKAKGDTCLNNVCWGNKLKLHTARKVDEVKAKGQALAPISSQGEGTVRYHQDNDPLEIPKGVTGKPVSYETVNIVKAGTPGAVPRVYVDGPEEGKVVYTLDKKPSKASEEQAEDAPKARSMMDRVAGHEVRRYVSIIKTIRSLLEEGKIETPKPRTVVALAIILGLKASDAGRYEDDDGPAYFEKNDAKAFRKAAALTPDGQVSALWNAVKAGVDTELSQAEANGKYGGPSPGEAVIYWAEVLGLDYKAMKADADTAIPFPKSWGDVDAALKEESKVLATGKGGRKK